MGIGHHLFSDRSQQPVFELVQRGSAENYQVIGLAGLDDSVSGRFAELDFQATVARQPGFFQPLVGLGARLLGPFGFCEIPKLDFA